MDDIRNYWMLKVLPLLETYGGKKRSRSNSAAAGGLSINERWTESDDINLLEGVEAQELSDADDAIDFSSDTLANERQRE